VCLDHTIFAVHCIRHRWSRIRCVWSR